MKTYLKAALTLVHLETLAPFLDEVASLLFNGACSAATPHVCFSLRNS